MRRLAVFLLLASMVAALTACSGGGSGAEAEVAGDGTGEALDQVADLDAARPPDVAEATDIAEMDLDVLPETPELEITADDQEIELPDVTPDEVEDVPEEDEYVAPPTEVGKPCESAPDCGTDAGCWFGFCTAFCKSGEQVIPGACDNSDPASPWGATFACPGDMDVCMPGAVLGATLVCHKDADCEEQGLPGFACAGAIPDTELEVAGRCLPVLDRKPAGSACQKSDGSVCSSLFCLHPWMDEGEPGVCSALCDDTSVCPGGTVCGMYPVYAGEDLAGYAPLCVPVEGSLKVCESTADCKVGKEFCGAVVQPGTYEAKFVCMETVNPQGSWLGESCSSPDTCFGPYCVFGPWANKVNAYCTHPCKSDADCSPQTQCRKVHLAPFEEITPDGLFEMSICLKVGQGASCFVAETGVCKFEWSQCKPIPAGYGWLGTCEDGTCPPSCEGKACKEDNGCGSPCLDACLGNGVACAGAEECLSGFCVDGLCCDAECGGSCVACNLSAMEGSCTPIANGTDPDAECGVCNRCNGAGGCKPVAAGQDAPGECGLCLRCDGFGGCGPVNVGTDPAGECGLCAVCDGNGGCTPAAVGDDPKGECEVTDAGTCGTTGVCDGLAGCEFWPSDIPCSDPKCAGFTFYGPSLCNGAGGCAPQAGKSCAPYVCNEAGLDCRTWCDANAHCAANHWCVAGACEPLPTCPNSQKLICNTQLPGTTLGLQNNWSAYDSCVPGVPYSAPERVYSVKMDKATKVTVTVSNLPHDAGLFLLEAACSPGQACKTYADQFPAAGGETLTFSAAAGIQHYLAVDGMGDSEKGNYTIATQCCTLKCAAENACGDDGCGGSCGTCGGDDLCHAGQCHKCADDGGAEENDVCTSAAPALEGELEAMLLCPDGDLDWYEIELAEGEQLTVDAVFDPAAMNLDMALYGGDCTTFITDAKSPDAVEKITYTAKQAGKFYLLVYAVDFAKGGYDLIIDKTAPQCVKDKDCPFGKVCGLYKCVTPPAACGTVGTIDCFAFIDGTTEAGAGKLQSYTRCTDKTYAGPESVYSLKLNQDTVVTITLMNQPFAGQVAALEKYCAPDWGCAAAGDTPGAGVGAMAQFKAKAATQYYVVVDGATGNDFGTFSLTADCCLPQCEGKVCGADGCGMDCGACPGEQDVCVEGQCVCQSDCAGKQCGDDGCGGSCGECLGPQDACTDGQCVCQPSCAGKQCGDDGCGGDCGACPGPQDACVEGQCVCQPSCAGKQCGDDGCGGDCGACGGAQDACVDSQCVCQPSCIGKQCGDDGCGGSCGACPGAQDACVTGKCICQPACAGKKCGEDGCGAVCGICSVVETCENFLCKCQSDNGFEPNDTCSKATPVTPATYPNLGICTGGDQDWYSIQLQAQQTIMVKAMFTHKNGDLDLYLYKQGNCVGYLASSSTSADNETIAYTSATQSSYLIRVVGFAANVSNSYTLQVTVQ